MFASAPRSSRTADHGFREKGGCIPATAEAVHSLEPGLWSKNREIWPLFVDSAASVGGNSLQSRLSGGEGGILLPPFLASADESYTYAIILCV